MKLLQAFGVVLSLSIILADDGTKINEVSAAHSHVTLNIFQMQ